MYKIIATQEFMDLLKELPIRYFHVLTKSFVSVEKYDGDTLALKENTFLRDMLEQIKSQELE